MLNKELQYEGDLVVLVYNERKGMLGTSRDLLGQFAIKLLNLRATKIQLKHDDVTEGYFYEYYNVVRESQVNGRLLAFFDLEPCPQESTEGVPRLIDGATATPPSAPPDGLTEAEITRLNKGMLESRVTVTVLGLRNLTKTAKKPVLTFRLTNDPKKEAHVVKVDDTRVTNQEATANPYVLNSVQFDVSLPDMYIDWPFLEVTLTDEGWFGCAPGHTTLLLLPYADYVAESDVKATLNVFNTNVEVTKTRARAGTSTHKSSSHGSKLSYRSIRTRSGSHRSSKSSRSAASSLSSSMSSGRMSKISEADEMAEEDRSDLPPVDEAQEAEEDKQERGSVAKSVNNKSVRSAKARSIIKSNAGDTGTLSQPMSMEEIEENKILEEDEVRPPD